MTEGGSKETALESFDQFLITQGRQESIQHGIDKTLQWRYFRLTGKGMSQCNGVIDLQRLFSENHEEPHHESFVKPVAFCKNFFAIPSSCSLQNLELHKTGGIIGLDVASGVAVNALQIEQGDIVLDLCCAPGGKLCMIAEAVGPTGFVLGVDISENRLDVCRALVRKIGLSNIALLKADGTNLWLPNPRCIDKNRSPFFKLNNEKETEDSDIQNMIGSDKQILAIWGTIGTKMNYWKMPHDRNRKKRSWKRRKNSVDIDSIMKVIHKLNPTNEAVDEIQFDKVLVDVECTHDGSIRHIEKFEWQWGWKTFEQRVLNEERLAKLNTLQKQLLRTGFRLLKEGGVLLYSTCSQCFKQNQEVIEDLLNFTPMATPVKLPYTFQSFEEVPSLKSSSLPANPIQIGSNRITAACQFDPVRSGTSGLFFCLLKKSFIAN